MLWIPGICIIRETRVLIVVLPESVMMLLSTCVVIVVTDFSDNLIPEMKPPFPSGRRKQRNIVVAPFSDALVHMCVVSRKCKSLPTHLEALVTTCPGVENLL